MLVLAKIDSYKWPVKYQRPSQTKPGEYDEQQFTAIFKRISDERVQELYGEVKSAAVAVLAKSALNFDSDKFFAEILLGWEDIRGSDGANFEHNEINRRILFSELGMKATIINAFFESINGAIRKN